MFLFFNYFEVFHFLFTSPQKRVLLGPVNTYEEESCFGCWQLEAVGPVGRLNGALHNLSRIKSKAHCMHLAGTVAPEGYLHFDAKRITA